MDCEIKGNKVLLPQGEADFSYPVKEVLEFGDKYVVRTEIPAGEMLNENVYAVDEKGVRLWQIQKTEHPSANSPYTKIVKKAGQLFAYNWDGTEVCLDINSGRFVSQNFVK